MVAAERGVALADWRRLVGRQGGLIDRRKTGDYEEDAFLVAGDCWVEVLEVFLGMVVVDVRDLP
jgi:hypothetical protein